MNPIEFLCSIRMLPIFRPLASLAIRAFHKPINNARKANRPEASIQNEFGDRKQ